MINLIRLWLIARVEWELQIRSLLFWVSLALVSLYSITKQWGLPPAIAFLPRQWIGAQESTLEWMGIGLLILAPSALARDSRTGVFLWTTPLSGGLYATSKLLGLWLTSLSLAGIVLVTQFLLRMSALEYLSTNALAMVFATLVIWSVNLFFLTTAYFFLSVLAKGQLLVSYALLTVYFILEFSVRDIANPLTLFPFPVFRSDLIGHGPETLFYNAHLWLYGGLLVLFTFLAISLYPRVEKRSLAPGKIWILTLIGLGIGLGSILRGVNDYTLARDQLLQLPRPHFFKPTALDGETLQKVRVRIDIEPANGIVDGRAEFDFAEIVAPIDLYIPPGLQISSVTDCHESTLSVDHAGSEWLQISPALQICATFNGSWHVARDQYNRNSSAEERQLNLLAYIGGGYAYLLPQAKWYPAPVGPYEQQAEYDIEIRLPSNLNVVAAAPTSTQDQGEWIAFRWEHPHGKPQAALAAGNYQQNLMADGNTIFVAPGHRLAAEQAARFYLEFLEPINVLVNQQESKYQIVEAPILRWPVVIGTTAFLPERYLIERLYNKGQTDFQIYEERLGQQDAFRQEAYYVARGWLEGQTFFADSPMTSALVEPTSAPNVDPYAMYQPLAESISHYLAWQLTDQKFGGDLLEQAFAKQIQKLDRGLGVYQPNNTMMEYDLVLNSFENRSEFTCTFAALGKLDHRIGRIALDQIIATALKQHSDIALTTPGWLKIVGNEVGEEARQEFESTCSAERSTRNGQK